MKKIKIENSNMENETVDGVTQIATWRPRRRRELSVSRPKMK